MEIFVSLAREFGLPVATFAVAALVMGRVIVVLAKQNAALYREIIHRQDDQLADLQADLNNLQTRLFAALGTTEQAVEVVKHVARDRGTGRSLP